MAAEGGGRDYAIAERTPLSGRNLESARKFNPTFDFAPHLCHMTAVVQDGWKLIHREDGRHELYHTRGDPDEQRNRYDTEDERAARLTRLVDEWRERVTPHPAAAGLESDDSPVVEKRLQDLGYF